MSVLAEPLTQTEDPGNGVRTLVEASIAGLCCVTFALTVLFVLVTLITGKTAGTRDFFIYWATGQQFAQHANPYDSSVILGLERQAGLPTAYGAMYMRNPPWMLPLTFPLAFFSVRTASMLWTQLLLACLGTSMHLLWRIHGSPGNRLHLLGYAFAPGLYCLMFGQTTIFVLLGLVLFLRLQASRPFMAGACLWLCALKPHLLLPFGVVLLTWVVISRSYRIIAGALVALVASAILVSLVDPMAWAQYIHMLGSSEVASGEFNPCVSVMLRLWLYPNEYWLRYLPTILACTWAFRYYWIRRHEWNWIKGSCLPVLVSVCFAPYSWPFDQVLIIPALLFAVYRTRSRSILAILAVLNVFFELTIYFDIRFVSHLGPFVWMIWAAPAWLAWYLLADRSSTPTFNACQEEFFAH